MTTTARTRIAVAGLAAASLLALTACTPTPTTAASPAPADSATAGGDIAVVYFSQSGTTAAFAEQLAEDTDGRLLELRPEQPYTGAATAIAERAESERRPGGTLPTLTGGEIDLDGVYTVLVGGPVWSGQVAPPVAAFLDDADLDGKTVAPFWTDSGSPRDYETDFGSFAESAARILPGIGLSSGEAPDIAAVREWAQQVTAPASSAATPGAADTADTADREVTITSGSTTATLRLNDSAAATEFADRLPVAVQTREMFGYEYYGPLETPLTTDGPLETGTEAGQVAFWTPGDQFVIYYDTPTRQPDGLLLLGAITDGLDRLADLGPTAELRITR